MNERIRELLKQAVFRHPRHLAVAVPEIVLRQDDLEKFAELIVGECMKLNHDHFNDEDPYSIDSLYRYHFGFKE